MGSREHHVSAATSHLIVMDMAALPMSENTSSSSSSWAPRPPAAKTVFSVMAVSAPLLYVSLLHVDPPYSSLLSDTNFWFLVSNAIILVLAAQYSAMLHPAPTSDDDDNVGPAGAYDVDVDVDEERYFAKHGRWRTCGGGGGVCPIQDPPRSSPQPLPDEDEGVLEELTSLAHPQAPLQQLVPVAAPGAAVAGDEEAASSSKPRRPPRRSASSSELGARRGGAAAHGGKRASSFSSRKIVLLRKPKTEMMGGRRRVVVQEEEAAAAEEESSDEYLTMSDEELNRRVEEFIRRFNMEIRRQDGMGDYAGRIPDHM